MTDGKESNIGSYVLLALPWINDSYQQISNFYPRDA